MAQLQQPEAGGGAEPVPVRRVTLGPAHSAGPDIVSAGPEILPAVQKARRLAELLSRMAADGADVLLMPDEGEGPVLRTVANTALAAGVLRAPAPLPVPVPAPLPAPVLAPPPLPLPLPILLPPPVRQEGPVPRVRRAQPNATGPLIAAGHGAPRQHRPQPQTGVPAAMQRGNTAWLTDVRRCQFHDCPLCAHRPLAPMDEHNELAQCTICTGRLPPTAMVTCHRCRQSTCIVCAMNSVAARRFRSPNEAMYRASCVFCRQMKRRVDIMLYDTVYREHSTEITDFVPALWAPRPRHVD